MRHLCVVCAMLVSVSALGQYKLVDGKVVPRNSPDWTSIYDQIEVVDFSGDALICRTFVEKNVQTGSQGGTGNMRFTPTYRNVKTYKDTFALINYPNSKRFKRGDVIHPPIAVMRIGSTVSQTQMGVVAIDTGSSSSQSHSTTTGPAGPTERNAQSSRSSSYRSSTGRRYDLYDYGIDYVPPKQKLTPEQAAATRASAAKASNEKDAVLLKFEQKQAAKGSALYQYRLGMRFLNGNAVQKDTQKARDYFFKAAAQGNTDAADELHKLSGK